MTLGIAPVQTQQKYIGNCYRTRPCEPGHLHRHASIGRRRNGLLTAGCVGRESDESTDGESDQSPADSGGPADETSEGTGDLSLTSPAFDDGTQIPERYGYEAENVNPPLEIGGVPAEAETLALVVDDPDAVEPAGKVWIHWLVWNIPPETSRIPEGWNPTEAIEGTNDYGSVGYGGPNPPDSPHRYRFKLLALDTTFDVASGADAETLSSAMEGHSLEQTVLVGTYPP